MITSPHGPVGGPVTPSGRKLRMTDAFRLRVRRSIIPLSFVVGLGVLYSVFAIRRHLTFQTAGWDLGIFEQAIRNYAAFRAPIVVLKGDGFNLLGDHFHPILITLAPFYRLFPGPITLLVAQALLFALAAWPLVRWAERSLGRTAAVAVGVVYGLSFGIASAVGFDFHEIAFAVPLIAFSLSALGQGRMRAAALWALPLVLVKEDLGITVVAMIGGLMFLRGSRRLGAIVAAIGVAATAVEVGILLPLLSSGGNYQYWTKVSSHPILVELVTAWGEKLVTLVLTLAITGFAALFSPIALAVIPTFAWRFAGGSANYWGTDYHYGAILMPIMVAALIDGLIRIRERRLLWGRAVPATLAVALAVTVLAIPSHRLGQMFSPELWTGNPRAASITAALKMIPDGATVSATDNLIPQLTARATVTLFGLRPLAATNPEWIIVDPSSSRRFVVTSAQEHQKLLTAEKSGYRFRFEDQGITLLQRAAP